MSESVKAADLLMLGKRQGVLEERIRVLEGLQVEGAEAEIRKIAELNAMEREVIEIVCRRHELMEAPRAEHSTAMGVRTITSLMIANGAALGILGAGLFESQQPAYVMKALGGAGWVFLVGLVLSGFIPPAMFIASRRQAKAWGLGIMAAMILSGICLFVGLAYVYVGAGQYVRCVNGATVQGVCEAKPTVTQSPQG